MKLTPFQKCLGFTGVLVASLFLANAGNAQITASEFGTVSQAVDGTVISIEYSRPSRRDRDVLFGGVMAYGQVITPGANMATTIEFSKDVSINGNVVPAGKYSDFVLHFNGTNGATAVSANDLGTMRLTFRGRQIQFTSFDRLQSINNLKGGSVLFSSVASGALSAIGFLPQAIEGDLLNILSVDTTDNVYLELNFSTAGGLVASGTVTIYGVEREGVQKYFYMLNNYDVTLGSGIYRERLPFENI